MSNIALLDALRINNTLIKEYIEYRIDQVESGEVDPLAGLPTQLKVLAEATSRDAGKIVVINSQGQSVPTSLPTNLSTLSENTHKNKIVVTDGAGQISFIDAKILNSLNGLVGQNGYVPVWNTDSFELKAVRDLLPASLLTLNLTTGQNNKFVRVNNGATGYTYTNLVCGDNVEYSPNIAKLNEVDYSIENHILTVIDGEYQFCEVADSPVATYVSQVLSGELESINALLGGN